MDSKRLNRRGVAPPSSSGSSGLPPIFEYYPSEAFARYFDAPKSHQNIYLLRKVVAGFCRIIYDCCNKKNLLFVGKVD